jgi:hypothetical protein
MLPWQVNMETLKHSWTIELLAGIGILAIQSVDRVNVASGQMGMPCARISTLESSPKQS